MSYYKKGSYFTSKSGRLHIFKRKDQLKGNKLISSSENWYGRTFIDGKQIQKSSGTSVKLDATKFLMRWYDTLQIRLDEGILIHTKNFKDCIKTWSAVLDKDTSIEQSSVGFYKDKIEVISKCKVLMNCDVNKVDTDFLRTHYIVWRKQRSKNQKKSLAHATLEGDCTAIQKFLNWCFIKGYRQTKSDNFKSSLFTKLQRSKKTSRGKFSKDQYNHLLKTSKERIKDSRGSEIRFKRLRLHYFIIFMCGSGLRVDEALKLNWGDIKFVDGEKDKDNFITWKKTFRSELERYYLIIKVRFSKVKKERDAWGYGSSYFALRDLRKLYNEYGINNNLNESIWHLKSYRMGFNTLLEEAKLKNIKEFGEKIKLDCKSFRHTFISNEISKGRWRISDLAKICGTSSKVIEEYYLSHRGMEEMVSIMRETKDKQHSK